MFHQLSVVDYLSAILATALLTLHLKEAAWLKYLPAMAAVKNDAKLPATRAFTTRSITSFLRSMASGSRTPRQTPMEVMVEKPHSMYVAITSDRSCKEEACMLYRSCPSQSCCNHDCRNHCCHNRMCSVCFLCLR